MQQRRDPEGVRAEPFAGERREGGPGGEPVVVQGAKRLGGVDVDGSGDPLAGVRASLRGVHAADGLVLHRESGYGVPAGTRGGIDGSFGRDAASVRTYEGDEDLQREGRGD